MIVILLFYMLPQGAVGKMGKEKPSGPNWGRKVNLPRYHPLFAERRTLPGRSHAPDP